MNHRASRHRIPLWVSAVIGEKCPDVVVLTEYVEGPDHDSFLEKLYATGLKHPSFTKRPIRPANDEDGRAGKPRFERQNQLLIVTREPHRCGNVQPPALHAALPSNVLHIILDETKVSLLGFRMPDYEKSRAAYRRQTWDWLLTAAAQMIVGPSIITGDFNTDPRDPGATGGRLLMRLSESGWQHARPQDGCSYRSEQKRSGMVIDREIDHTFLSPSLRAMESPKYDWEFLAHLSDSRCNPGCPDHAMLVADIVNRAVVPDRTLA